MRMRLKDKIAIVTGAGSGIGRASAIAFAKEGAKVVVHGRRETNTLETWEAVKGISSESIYVLGDVRKEEDVKGVVSSCVGEFGGIDILFNNAGVGYSSPYCLGPIQDIPAQDWDEVFAINLRGMFFFCKYVIPVMMKQNGGAVINCSSVMGVVGCGAESYAATKGGIIALTRALAVENGKHNIRVNSISPGTTRTAMIEELLGSEEFCGQWTNMPIKGVAEPEDVAYAAVFLASDESRFITGHNLVVDGGFTIS